MTIPCSSMPKNDYINENEWIERCLEQISCDSIETKQVGFAELYEILEKQLFSFALSKVYNYHDAQDIMHDTFLRIWEKSQTYSNEGKAKSWIFTIENNLIKDSHMEKARVNLSWENTLEDVVSDLNLENGVVLRELLTRLMDSTLSEVEKQIISLTILYGYKNKEVAEILDLPLGTVCSYRKRALEKLRKGLEDTE